MSGGPWVFFDHYWIAKIWTIDFIAEGDTIDNNLARVHFPSLNTVYYDEIFFLGLDSVVGKPINVDTNTL
uniref:Uncharacterized protein n=1 Tax=Glycine max TaxID=3847 RepID=K7L390_SOYBN